MSFQSIDDMNMTQREREQHFFRKGYEYALLHFGLAVEKEHIVKGLEKRIRKHMDFLDNIEERVSR